MWAHQVVQIQHDHRPTIATTFVRLLQLILHLLQRPRLAMQLELLGIDDLIDGLIILNIVVVDATTKQHSTEQKRAPQAIPRAALTATFVSVSN